MTEKLNIYAARLIPKREWFAPGHRACPGCAQVLGVRLAGKALDRRVIVACATGCLEIVSSPLPLTSWRVPWIHIAFENTAAVASGIEAGLKILMEKGRLARQRIVVVAMAGDGGTADIGLQALSGALERDHNFLYLCFDNEAYMNTGGQRSSTTPQCASTTTCPAGVIRPGQPTRKKSMPAIAAAHEIPYVATACPSYPFDLMDKVQKGALVRGPAYIHILAPCPRGWGFPSELTIKMGRLAVESGAFPLYEVEQGRYRLTLDLPSLLPAGAYLKSQERFKHLTEEMIEEFQRSVNHQYAKLKALSY